eukprot:5925244-Amphidinium_carterae.1
MTTALARSAANCIHVKQMFNAPHLLRFTEAANGYAATGCVSSTLLPVVVRPQAEEVLAQQRSRKVSGLCLCSTSPFHPQGNIDKRASNDERR